MRRRHAGMGRSCLVLELGLRWVLTLTETSFNIYFLVCHQNLIQTEPPKSHSLQFLGPAFTVGHHYHWKDVSKCPPLPISVSFCTVHLSGRVPSMPGGLCRPQLRQRTGERDVSPWESPLTASDDGWPDYGVLFTHTQFTSHWAAGSGRAVEHIRVFQAGHRRSHACVCLHTRMHGSARVRKIRRGLEITKEKGANSLLQPCHVRSIWQINPLLRRRWLSPPPFQSRPLSFWYTWWHVKSDF